MVLPGIPGRLGVITEINRLDDQDTALGARVDGHDTDIAARPTTTVADASYAAKAATEAALARLEGRTLNIRHPDYGATGDGATDDSAAFLAATQAAFAARRASITGVATDPSGTVVIDLPPGVYTITELNGLLGREAPTEKVWGLRFRGAGSGLTIVVFDPASDGALVTNTYWMNVAFSGITFSTLYAGATFLESVANNGVQRYIFDDCAWWGEWQYVCNLTGTDNNSEFTFRDCETAGMQAGGAFLYIGTASTSDQFLNYWFYGFKHWSTSAAILDVAKGGQFHFYGLDVSAWGSGLVSPAYLFLLKGVGHGHGVEQLHIHGMRMEMASDFACLLYTEWADGNISIQADLTGQLSAYTYGDIILVSLQGVNGPIIRIHDSRMAGGIEVEYATGGYQTQPGIFIENTRWHQKLTPSEVVTYTPIGAHTELTEPLVEFVDCRFDNDEVYTANGYSVGDAIMGGGSPMVIDQPKRSLRVGATFGTGDWANINLPIGAIITGLTVLVPAGLTAEADGAVWTLATQEAVPTTIATATVPGAMSAGAYIEQPVSPPFLCSTRDRASIHLEVTGLTTNSYDFRVLIEGYW